MLLITYLKYANECKTPINTFIVTMATHALNKTRWITCCIFNSDKNWS